MNKLISISGILIFLSFISTLISYFFDSNILIISGIFAWIAFFILFFSLKSKKMLIILLVLSVICFFISYVNEFKIDIKKVFTINQYLLTLLIGVGFLRLIAKPKKENLKKLPTGKKAFLKTYLGVHLFGSVINLSSLILVADKMYNRAKLTNTQIVLLTRAFASDAYWSPFFVAFAAAITYAPRLDTSIIIINGVFLAFIAFLFTYNEVLKSKSLDINSFVGYPLSLETLILPFVLALLILFTNYFFPSIKVIVLIALFSFILCLIVLPIKKGVLNTIKILKDFILDELPLMKTELSLFLVAGMFGVSVSSILLGLDIVLPFEKFDWFIASILLAVFIVLAFIGIHPIITIAMIGDYLSSVNNTLLAVTFLMAWSTTVSTSPFSGLNLTIVSRYCFEAKQIFKLNIKYVLKMYILSIICLFLISNYLNV